MTERIDSIDIFRGIAVLQMIFWQIFDFFAKVDIYTQSPYYIRFFNMPINGIGVGLFAFISGVCAYISVSKRLNRNIRKPNIILHAIKRYGGYILLSLFFTILVFGFKTFYTWNEAIQGIGLAALTAALIILLSRSKWLFVCLSLIIIFIQPFLRQLLENNFITQYFPYNPASFNIFPNIVSIFLNFTIRGFFSLSNLLPITWFGVVLSILIIKSKKNQLIKAPLLIVIIITLISISLHFSFNQINYYNRSPSYLLFYIGGAFLLFSLIEYLILKFEKNIISNFFVLFGKTALVAYLFHFVFIYKPLKILNIDSTFGSPTSFLLTILSIIIIYYVCKMWLLKKHLIFDKIRIINKWTPLLWFDRSPLLFS